MKPVSVSSSLIRKITETCVFLSLFIIIIIISLMMPSSSSSSSYASIGVEAKLIYSSNFSALVPSSLGRIDRIGTAATLTSTPLINQTFPYYPPPKSDPVYVVVSVRTEKPSSGSGSAVVGDDGQQDLVLSLVYVDVTSNTSFSPESSFAVASASAIFDQYVPRVSLSYNEFMFFSGLEPYSSELASVVVSYDNQSGVHFLQQFGQDSTVVGAFFDSTGNVYFLYNSSKYDAFFVGKYSALYLNRIIGLQPFPETLSLESIMYSAMTSQSQVAFFAMMSTANSNHNTQVIVMLNLFSLQVLDGPGQTFDVAAEINKSKLASSTSTSFKHLVFMSAHPTGRAFDFSPFPPSSQPRQRLVLIVEMTDNNQYVFVLLLNITDWTLRLLESNDNSQPVNDFKLPYPIAVTNSSTDNKNLMTGFGNSIFYISTTCDVVQIKFGDFSSITPEFEIEYQYSSSATMSSEVISLKDSYILNDEIGFVYVFLMVKSSSNNSNSVYLKIDTMVTLPTPPLTTTTTNPTIMTSTVTSTSTTTTFTSTTSSTTSTPSSLPTSSATSAMTIEGIPAILDATSNFKALALLRSDPSNQSSACGVDPYVFLLQDPSGHTTTAALIQIVDGIPVNKFLDITQVEYATHAFPSNDQQFAFYYNIYQKTGSIIRVDLAGTAVTLNGQGQVGAGVSFPRSSEYIILVFFGGTTSRGVRKYRQNYSSPEEPPVATLPLPWMSSASPFGLTDNVQFAYFVVGNATGNFYLIKVNAAVGGNPRSNTMELVAIRALLREAELTQIPTFVGMSYFENAMDQSYTPIIAVVFNLPNSGTTVMTIDASGTGLGERSIVTTNTGAGSDCNAAEGCPFAAVDEFVFFANQESGIWTMTRVNTLTGEVHDNLQIPNVFGKNGAHPDGWAKMQPVTLVVDECGMIYWFSVFNQPIINRQSGMIRINSGVKPYATRVATTLLPATSESPSSTATPSKSNARKSTVLDVFPLADITHPFSGSTEPLNSNSDATLNPHVGTVSPSSNSSIISTVYLFDPKDAQATFAVWDTSAALASPEHQKANGNMPVVWSTVYERINISIAPQTQKMRCNYQTGFQSAYNVMDPRDQHQQQPEQELAHLYSIERYWSPLSNPGHLCNNQPKQIYHFAIRTKDGVTQSAATIAPNVDDPATQGKCLTPLNGIHFSASFFCPKAFVIILCYNSTYSWSLIRYDQNLQFQGQIQYGGPEAEYYIPTDLIAGNNNDRGNNIDAEDDSEYQKEYYFFVILRQRNSVLPGRFVLARYSAQTLQPAGNVTFNTNNVDNSFVGMTFFYPYLTILFGDSSLYRFRIDAPNFLPTQAPTILPVVPQNVIMCYTTHGSYNDGCPFTSLRNFIFFATSDGSNSVPLYRMDILTGQVSSSVPIPRFNKYAEQMHSWDLYVGGDRILYFLNRGTSLLGTRWSGAFRIDSGVVIGFPEETTTTTIGINPASSTASPFSSTALPPKPELSLVGSPFDLSKDATVFAIGMMSGLKENNNFTFAAQREVHQQCQNSPQDISLKMFGVFDQSNTQNRLAEYEITSPNIASSAVLNQDLSMYSSHAQGMQYGEYFFTWKLKIPLVTFNLLRSDAAGNIISMNGGNLNYVGAVVGFEEKYLVLMQGTISFPLRPVNSAIVHGVEVVIYSLDLNLQKQFSAFNVSKIFADQYSLNVTHVVRMAHSDQIRYVYFMIRTTPLNDNTGNGDANAKLALIQLDVNTKSNTITLVSTHFFSDYTTIDSYTQSGMYFDQASLDPTTGFYNDQYLFLFMKSTVTQSTLILSFKTSSQEGVKLPDPQVVLDLGTSFPYCTFYGESDYQASCPIAQIPNTPYFVGSIKEDAPFNFFQVQRINAMTGESTSPLQIPKNLFDLGVISPATLVMDLCGNAYFAAALWKAVIYRHSRLLKIDTGVQSPPPPQIFPIGSVTTTTSGPSTSSSTTTSSTTTTSITSTTSTSATMTLHPSSTSETSSSSSSTPPPSITSFSSTTTSSENPTTKPSSTSTSTSIMTTTATQTTPLPTGSHNHNNNNAANNTNTGNDGGSKKMLEMVGIIGGCVILLIVIGLLIYARSKRTWCFAPSKSGVGNRNSINDRFNDYDQALRSEVGDFEEHDDRHEIDSQSSLNGIRGTSTLSTSSGSPNSFFNRVASTNNNTKNNGTSSAYAPPQTLAKKPSDRRRTISNNNKTLVRDAADVGSDEDATKKILSEPLMLEDSVEVFKSDGDDDDDETAKHPKLSQRGKNNNNNNTISKPGSANNLRSNHGSRRNVKQQGENTNNNNTTYSPREGGGEADRNNTNKQEKAALPPATTLPIDPDREMLLKFGFPPEAILKVEDIAIAETLGSGGSATVYNGSFVDEKMRTKFGCQKLAIKQFRERPESMQKALREILRSYKLHHPNIVRCIGIIISRSAVFIDILMIMEKGERTLQDLIEIKQNNSNNNDNNNLGAKSLSIPTCLEYAKQIAAGLCFLHNTSKPMIVHADIKPGNIILFNNNTQLKIIDFGFAKETEKSKTDASQLYFGTMKFMAPECTFSAEMRPTTDVYSFGVICFWLFSGNEPYPRATLRQITSGRLWETFEPREGVTEQMIQLTKDCLNTRPEYRPKNGAELVERLDEM